MIAALDVHYGPKGARAAGILFEDWDSEQTTLQVMEIVADTAPYEAGRFYKRELPCLLKVLTKMPEAFDTVIVDGYVWLSPDAKPGLGAHLFQAFDGEISVVGVAKSRFVNAAHAVPVYRGRSRKPLYVSSIGIDPLEAAKHVGRMHGAHRIPALLKLVDRLARGHGLCP
ncbi:MAG: endonuclease V [Desulfomonile sp.]|nr:endonuclease V [Desulfomonile sp.]